MQEVISLLTVRKHHSIWNHKYKSLFVSKNLREFVEKSFRSLDGDGFRIFFWYLNSCSYRDKYGNILLERKLLSQFEGRDEENTQAEKFLIRFNEMVLRPVGGELKYSGYSHQEHQCRTVESFHMGVFHEEFLRLWHSHQNIPKDSRNSQGLVFASTGKVAKYSELRKFREQERQEAMSRPCGALTKELLEYLNGELLCTQVYTELIKRNWDAAHNACLQIKDQVLREQQLRLLLEIKRNPRAYYFPSFWGLTPRVFTHGGIPELKRELRIILCDGWHDADLVSSQLAICASLWKLKKVQRFLKTKRKIWDEIREALNIPIEIWEKFKPYVKEALYTICYGGGEWMVREPLFDGIKILGLNLNCNKILDIWIFKELRKGQEEIEKRIEAEGGMEDAEGKFCELTKGRKVSSVMAEVAQSYELRILISVIRLAKQTDNKLFKITVWQHDGFSMYIERNPNAVYKKIQETVQKELKDLEIETELEIDQNKKEDIVPSNIEKRKKKDRKRNKRKIKNKFTPFASRFKYITEKNTGRGEKPSPQPLDLIKLDIAESEDANSLLIKIAANSMTKEAVAQSDSLLHTGYSKGFGIDGRVNAAELRLTA